MGLILFFLPLPLSPLPLDQLSVFVGDTLEIQKKEKETPWISIQTLITSFAKFS